MSYAPNTITAYETVISRAKRNLALRAKLKHECPAPHKGAGGESHGAIFPRLALRAKLKHECPAPTRGRGRITVPPPQGGGGESHGAIFPRLALRAKLKHECPAPIRGRGRITRRALRRLALRAKLKHECPAPTRGAGENHTARLKEACAPRKAVSTNVPPPQGGRDIRFLLGARQHTRRLMPAGVLWRALRNSNP